MRFANLNYGERELTINYINLKTMTSYMYRHTYIHKTIEPAASHIVAVHCHSSSSGAAGSRNHKNGDVAQKEKPEQCI